MSDTCEFRDYSDDEILPLDLENSRSNSEVENSTFNHFKESSSDNDQIIEDYLT